MNKNKGILTPLGYAQGGILAHGHIAAVRYNGSRSMINKTIKRNTMKTLATIAISAAAVAGLAWAVNFGLDRQEVVDCNTWAQQADAYPAFYLTHWQKEQCDAHGIIISAPVK